MFLAEVSELNFVLFVLFVGIVFALLIALFWFSRTLYISRESPSPYTGTPLRRASELPFMTKIYIERYLKQLRQYDNRPFNINKAAFCRDTGRIFPNCQTWTGAIVCDWNFLQKRYPGSYVSWGSLSKEQKEELQKAHGIIIGFQTEQSCPEPLPKMIQEDYVFTSPGPLYVDLSTQMLLGWKSVPDTDFEVLIVQKPLIVSMLNVQQIDNKKI